MPSVPGLRSAYDKVGRWVYFGRMLDKIRLHAAGKLPADYASNLGNVSATGFDARCCRFLRIDYGELTARALAGGTDEQVLQWAEQRGGSRTDEECETWNGFMTKRGWRDERSPRLRQLLVEFGLSGKPIETTFDLFDFDEGRDPRSRY
jgi:gluconokinase